MDKKEIKEILVNHKHWVDRDYKELERMGANLYGADLYDPMKTMIDEMLKTENDLRERSLAKVIQENDFVVNNGYMKIKLEEVLPKEAKISISPYVEENTVIMIKKAIIEPYLLPYDFFDELKEKKNET